MSLQSWIEEFYPIEANVCAATSFDVLDILDHSIRKWTGRIKHNLNKHDTENHPHRTQAIRSTLNGEHFYFDTLSCSLCAAYVSGGPIGCQGCPIVDLTGRKCAYPPPNSDIGDSYYLLACESSPTIMVILLQQCKAKILRERAASDANKCGDSASGTAKQTPVSGTSGNEANTEQHNDGTSESSDRQDS